MSKLCNAHDGVPGPETSHGHHTVHRVEWSEIPFR